MKQQTNSMGVGASSILLILVVVSLTLFASLALIQARSDAALTQKTAVSTRAYYDADTRAQTILAALDDAAQQDKALDSIEGVTKQADGSYAFSVEASDGHALNVVVGVSGKKCEILSYRYENTQDWTEQSTGTLWQGG
jgi:hypothetical protein